MENFIFCAVCSEKICKTHWKTSAIEDPVCLVVDVCFSEKFFFYTSDVVTYNVGIPIDIDRAIFRSF